jgi:hypothetical protein
MKHRHNKKRNTALLFEILVKELTKTAVSKDGQRKNTIVFIMKQHFRKGTCLSEELEIYKSLSDNQDLDKEIAEKILQEAKHQYSGLNHKLIFNEQTSVINKINKFLGPSSFDNFVPSYKF